MRRVLLVACAAAVRAAPTPSTHVIAAADSEPVWSADTMCHAQANPHPLDFQQNCPAGSTSCWPLLYLLGVQKAATTSVAMAMLDCGIAAFGMPDKVTGEISECDDELADGSMPCKETLHSPINISTNEGVGAFTRLQDTTKCENIKWRFKATKGACSKGMFMEPTPLGIGDAPTFSVLASAMPQSVLQRARFLLILREPVARLLSWFNHVHTSGDIYNIGGTAHDGQSVTSSFATYWKYVSEKQTDTFKMGKYIHLLEGFTEHKAMQRSQLLVIQFEKLVADPKEGMRLLTSHYGTPILTDVAALPEENTHDAPNKVVSIMCSTRDAVNKVYEEFNTALYARLDYDHAWGAASAYEPHFDRFDVTKVPCNNIKELEMGHSA